MRRQFEGEIVGLGRITMREPSVGAMTDALRVHREAEPERADSQFTDTMLAGMISDPPMTADQVAGLPDDAVSDLINLAVTDVLNLSEELSELPDGLSPREMFAAAYVKHIEEFMHNIGRMAADSATQALQSLGDTLAKNINDHLADATAFRAGLDLSDFLGRFASQVLPVADLSEMMKVLLKPSPELQETMQGLKALAEQSTMPLQERISGLNSYGLGEPFLSDNLVKSGLNSSYMHSPAYQAPVLQLPRSPLDIPGRADDAERERLRDSYDLLMELEMAFRGIIEQELFNLAGPKWWRTRVPEAVRDECEGRKQAKEKPFRASHDPISYAYVHDLRAIIVRSDNWRDVFQRYFHDKQEIEVMFDWVGGVRASVAHFRPIDETEYQQLVVAANIIRRGIDRVF